MAKGERIKSLREKEGYSQTELAERVNISKQTLYKYENNIITNIPSDILEKIASVLGCSPSYFMGWDDYTPPEGTRTFVNPHKIHVTDEEEKIILAYRVADDFDQRFVRRILNIDDGEKENSLDA